ncbi:MAG TPA: hypothetical protein DCZ43_04510, partial [candidate division Zixibacteria bacterium]|nr:hypothetical protein [candidate division Zixibacteria bacterium]
MDDGKELTDLKAELEKLRKQIREFEQISNQNKKDIGTSARHPWRNDLILHNSPDGLALVGMDGKIIDANPALCRILGYPKDELIGIDIRILEAREVPEETTNHMNKIAKEGGDRFETRLRRLDGSIIDAEINTNLCDNGDERFFITFTQDITQRKEAEEALRESEEKYRTLVEMSPYAIAIFQDDKLVFANQTAERLIWGASGEKLIGRIGFEMVSEHDRDRLRDYAKKRYQGDSSAPNHYRVDLIRANGEIFPAEIFSNRIIYRGRPAIQLMATDITDRITAAKALQESETKFRTLVEQINAVTYEALPDENVSAIYVSPQIQKLIGFTADEIISNPFLWLGQIHPDDRQRVKDEIARTFPHGLPFSLEYRLLSKDGRIVWVHDEAIPKCDAQGRPIGFHGVILDITRLKETEATLAFSEKRFQQLFNSALEGISIHDPQYIIQFCNPSLANIFEINDVSEIIGKSTLDYMPDDQKQIIIDQLELRKKGLATQYELNIVTVRNNRKTLLVSSSPIFDPDGKFQGSLSAVIDITERRELEKIQNTLMRISEATSLTESLEELLQTIRNAIGDLVDTSNFYIALWDDNTEVYSFPYRVDSISPAPGGPVKLVNTLTDFVRRTGQPLLATAEDREKLGLSVDFDNINKTPISWLGVPLKIFERVIGVVAVQAYSSEGFYTERDLKYLSMVAGHIGMAIERKRAEDDLRESERRFHDLFEHFASGYILCKVVTNDAGQPVDFIYLEVNKAFEIITGKSATEVINKSATEVFPIDYDIELIKLCGEVALTGTPVRTERFSLATGRYLEMMIYSTRYGEFASVFSDVSEKKIAEKALHDSEERYRAIWENSPVGICMTDPNGVYHYVNKTYCNIYGYSSEELIGRPFYDLIMPPERRASARVSFAKNFGKSKTGELSETEIFIRKNGEPVSIQFTSDYVMQDGQPKYEVAMNIDVTEKKRAVDALRESEERYRLLIENADDIIVNLDYSGKILLLNRAAARYFKKAPSELVGQTIWDLFPAETAQHYIASVRKTLDSNETLNI